MLDQLRKLMALRQTPGAYDPTSQEQLEPGPGVPNQRNPYPLIDEQVQAGAELSPIAKGLDKLGALRATKEAVGRVPVLRELAGGMLEPATQMAEIPNVFHGSPYRFDKFDLGKVGTGEGAQAFGHGLYFTSKKEIAQHYKNAGMQNKGVLVARDSKGNIIMQGDDWDSIALDAYKYLDSGKQAAGQFPHNTAYYAKKAYEDSFKYSPDMLQQPRQQAVLGKIDELSKAKIAYEDLPGKVYTSTLMPGKKPEDYTFMDWHEPVDSKIMNKFAEGYDQQLSKFQGQSRYAPLSSKEAFLKNFEGKDTQGTYRTLASLLGTDAAASKFLKQSGIDGIRYPTETLSGKAKGGGGWNYVVFDDKDIKITGVE